MIQDNQKIVVTMLPLHRNASSKHCSNIFKTRNENILRYVLQKEWSATSWSLYSVVYKAPIEVLIRDEDTGQILELDSDFTKQSSHHSDFDVNDNDEKKYLDPTSPVAAADKAEQIQFKNGRQLLLGKGAKIDITDERNG